MVSVAVPDQSRLDMAIKIFRKKGQKEGIIKEAKRRKEYLKPSEAKKLKREESLSRIKRKRR